MTGAAITSPRDSDRQEGGGWQPRSSSLSEGARFRGYASPHILLYHLFSIILESIKKL